MLTITQIVDDTTPRYRINYLPERYNENLLRPSNLTPDENNRLMKKLSLIEWNENQYMELTEDQIIEKYGKECLHCMRNTLLPYDYKWSISCSNKVVKRRNELHEDTTKIKYKLHHSIKLCRKK